jgi:capsular exopolysaccharide synthesis family protein
MNHQLVPSQQPSPFNSARWSAAPPMYAPSLDGNGTTYDMTRVLSDLRRRWWLVAMFTIGAGATAWFQVHQQPKVYTASVVVQLLDSRDNWTGGLLKSDAARTPVAYSMLSQVEIIRSGAVAETVVDSEPLGLRVYGREFSDAILSDVALDSAVSSLRIPLAFTATGVIVGHGSQQIVPYGRPTSLAGVRFTVLRQPAEITHGDLMVRAREYAVARLRLDLDADPRKQTNLIDIGYRAADAVTAQRVVNRVAHVYQAVNTRLAQQQVHRRRVFVEEQLAHTDAQLAEADRALSSFRNRQQAYSSQDKFKSQQNALLDLDLRRQELDGDRKMARGLLKKFETGDDAARKSALSMLASAPEISSDRSPVPDLYRRLIEYERTRAELTSGPTGKTRIHPDVQRMDTLIASTQSELISGAQAHVSLLDARIEALDEARSRDASALGELPAAEAAEIRLQQNVDALRGQAVSLRTEYQQARISEAAEVGQVDIVDLARGAGIAQSTGPRLIFFAVFLGLLLGGGFALVLENADRTVKRRDDIELSLQIPVLGTIPRIDGDELRKGRFPVLSGLAGRQKSEVTRRRTVATTSASQTRSSGAEAFRHLAANLFCSRVGDSARRVLVTSPTEGDGKTSIAANLAITLANQRHRVLLVDCDLCGKLHNIFRLPDSPGLSEVILDRIAPSSVLQSTTVSGLYVMTSGRPPEKAADIMGSERMRAMLNDLAQDFDLVILDCSPILALADSTILSVNSDAVLLVVRVGHTAASAAVEAMRSLSTVGARVGGVVLNDPDERARHYADYHYGYSYAGR